MDVIFKLQIDLQLNLFQPPPPPCLVLPSVWNLERLKQMDVIPRIFSSFCFNPDFFFRIKCFFLTIVAIVSHIQFSIPLPFASSYLKSTVYLCFSVKDCLMGVYTESAPETFLFFFWSVFCGAIINVSVLSFISASGGIFQYRLLLVIASGTNHRGVCLPWTILFLSSVSPLDYSVKGPYKSLHPFQLLS